jgi:small-conductance mechanosensitive channel
MGVHLWQTICYLLSAILLVIAALGAGPPRRLALLGAAAFVVAYALPVVVSTS